MLTTVSRYLLSRYVPVADGRRLCMTAKNKRGRIGHHSSTTGISINILQWCHSQPRAVEQWRHVSHCLVCLLVGFRECSALGAPGGKTGISSDTVQAEMCVCVCVCFLARVHDSQWILYRNFSQANRSEANMS